MEMHDKFNWTEPASDYYKNRIKNLEEQLQTLKEHMAIKSKYVTRLEDEMLALTEENEKLKSALIGMALRAEA